MIDPSYAPGEPNEILPTANYYFMFISTFLITIIGLLGYTNNEASRRRKELAIRLYRVIRLPAYARSLI